MKNFNQKFVYFLLFCMIITFSKSNVFAFSKTQENLIKSTELAVNQIVKSSKIYLNSEQIFVTNQGIFVDLYTATGELTPVDNLCFDQDGLYMFFKENKCEHEPYCNSCGGCNPNNRCGGRCKCPEYSHNGKNRYK